MSMTGSQFEQLLARAGLRQADVPRLVERLAGERGPDAVAVNRYCKGRVGVPAPLIALIRLWSQLPLAERERILPRG